MSRSMSTRASTTAFSSGVQQEHERQKCVDCPRNERYALPPRVSPPLSLERFRPSPLTMVPVSDVI
jgi:hypothetical protein